MVLIRGLLLPVLILLTWAAASYTGLVNPYLLPSPSGVIEAGRVLLYSGELARHMAVSFTRVLFGFLITFITAFPLAVIVGIRPRLAQYLEPVLEFIRHIPPIACIPLLILWFGIGETPKLAVIFLATFFPIFLNTMQGIAHCDQQLVEVGTVYGFSKKDTIKAIMLPAALPSIITGLRLGLGYSWRSLIGAELIAASSGIGYMIMDAEQLSRPDVVMVGILAIGLMGYAIDFFCFYAARRLLPWRGGEAQHGWN